MQEVSKMNVYKNAIGYIRVNTDGQATEDKHSIEAQKQAILLYANDRPSAESADF